MSEAAGAHNVARFLPELAARDGGRIALIEPSHGAWRSTTYAELDQLCDRLAHGLAAAGLARGDRTCVLVPPGREWIALISALFKLGAVPVLIDPGMGVAALSACMERMTPRAFVGVPRAHLLRLFKTRAVRSVELFFTAGAAWLGSGPSLASFARDNASPRALADVAPSDEAAILFTSGSTGPPKGVAYTHANFDAQIRALRELYGFRAGDVDLACFAPFALFNAALGLTTVLPDIDFRRPATCDPARVVAAIAEHHVTTTFGSPAIWRRVIPWCRKRGVTLPSVRRLMIAGAPVENALLAQCLEVLAPEADVCTPYGATEALPVSNASARELTGPLRARSERGEGTCVGTAAPGIEIRLIKISDEAVASMDRAQPVPPGEAGEICVRGAVVTREYKLAPEFTAAAKIADGASFWHRMGDAGRFDADGRLWFLGRVAHRLETARGTLFPVPLENAFRLHPSVARCAVVGVGARGRERPVLVIETLGSRVPSRRSLRAELSAEILRAGLWFPQCAAVEAVLYKRRFPLDVRHNAKIDRTALKRWAERELA